MASPTLKSVLAIALLSLVGADYTRAQTPLPRLRVDGQRIVDPAGNAVFLHGVNLGNWLLIEPGVFNKAIGAFKDQYTLFETLRQRFGEAERRRLIDVYRDHFITARDFDNVKRFGFNFVRIGFDYELLEDDERPMQLRPDAFKYLDFAVAQAKARGIYVLFDLHGAQERQVSGRQGGREGYSRFWTDPKAQERSLWMWRQIFEHFKGDPTIFGYEQLNEPFSAKPEQLLDYSLRWYKTLREVDSDAVAVFHGLQRGITFYGKPADHGWTNCMFDMHFYPGSFTPPTTTRPVTPETNSRFLQLTMPRWVERMNEVNTPLLVGEMNVVYKEAGGGEMVRRYYDFCRQHNWAITFWTLKELNPQGGFNNRYWMLTSNTDPIPPVDHHTASKEEIESTFRSLSTMRLTVDPDNLHWLTTNDTPTPLKPIGGPTTRGETPGGAQPNATTEPSGAQPNATGTPSPTP